MYIPFCAINQWDRKYFASDIRVEARPGVHLRLPEPGGEARDHLLAQVDAAPPFRRFQCVSCGGFSLGKLFLAGNLLKLFYLVDLLTFGLKDLKNIML